MSSHAASRAAKFASRSQEVHYKGFNIPSDKNDFFTSYKAKSGFEDAESNDVMIAAFPDLRPLFAMCLFAVMKYYPTIDLKGHAKVSPATTLMYFLTVSYAYIFFNDLSISGSPSRHALAIKQDDQLYDYMLTLLELPMPTFLKTWCENLCFTTLDGNNSVFAILSAAGYSHAHDFGRLIPLSFCSNLHDLFPKSVEIRSQDAIWAKLFSLPLYSAHMRHSANAAQTILMYNILGMTIDGTEASFVAHRLQQLVESTFNPFLSKSYARRDSFTRINITHSEFDTIHVNPYHIMFSLNAENITELSVVNNAVRDAIKGTVPCTSDLAGTLTTQAGNGLFRHGYSMYGLPTHVADPITTATGNAVTSFKQIKPDAFAAKIHFKQQHDFTVATDVPFPSHDADAANSHLDLVLINAAAPGTPAANHVPAKTAFVKFDVRDHQYPSVLVLNPGKKDPETAYLATLCGLVIEADEIDGTGLPFPHPQAHIGDTNNDVLSSAIHLQHVRPATTFISDNAKFWHHSMIRQRADAPAFRASTLLTDMTRIVIPRYAMLVTNVPTAATTPGLHLWRNVTDPRRVLRFYGTQTKSFHNKDDLNDGKAISAPANVENGSILVWSPYRYVSMRNRAAALTSTQYDDIYMLTNLRTIFGVQAPLTGAKHFMAALPN